MVSKYGWDGEKQLRLADLDHTSSSYTWIDGYWDSREAYDRDSPEAKSAQGSGQS